MNYRKLIETEGYKVLLTLPSYIVLQHPKTFHTMLFHQKPPVGDLGTMYRAMGDWKLPGLTSDPTVGIPAGMWREWMKVTRAGKKLGSMDDPSIEELPPSHPPPTPRVNARSYLDAVRTEMRDFVNNTAIVTGRTIPEQAMNQDPASIDIVLPRQPRLTAPRLWTNADIADLPTRRPTPPEERND